jgi:R.HinP1I restriction endonuclease
MNMNTFLARRLSIFAVLTFFAFVAHGQQSAAAKLGSDTAKNGFKNEDEIRDKFNAWKTDEDARVWLAVMNHKVAEIESVIATKPHGEKADVEVVVKTKRAEKKEGISIKLVSSPNGFNQIDKRWLSHYVAMWKIPADIETGLKLFLGELPPTKPGRDVNRMYLDELEAAQQRAIIEFFTANRTKIVHDLFSGDGPHAAGWVMVALKASEKPKWVLRSDKDTIAFFGEGKIEITSHGNLKIGRITMQRKGGDGGRDTAKMLQFKINPALLFGAK